jgi:hypothetical protein
MDYLRRKMGSPVCTNKLFANVMALFCFSASAGVVLIAVLQMTSYGRTEPQFFLGLGVTLIVALLLQCLGLLIVLTMKQATNEQASN